MTAFYCYLWRIFSYSVSVLPEFHRTGLQNQVSVSASVNTVLISTIGWRRKKKQCSGERRLTYSVTSTGCDNKSHETRIQHWKS